MRRGSFLVLALFAMIVTGCKSGDEVAVAPSATPGAVPAVATASLEQAGESAPAVLYFVATDCGSNPEAIPLVQSIYKANEGKGKFFVVMNTDAEGAAKWSKENKTTFPIIPDPDKEVIGRYKIEFSQTGVMVDSGLNETKRFAGYGKAVLEDLNKSLANGGEAAKVDLSGAPDMGFG